MGVPAAGVPSPEGDSGHRRYGSPGTAVPGFPMTPLRGWVVDRTGGFRGIK